MPRKRFFVYSLLFGVMLLCGFSTRGLAADRGGITSGETKIGINLSGPSYMDTWTFEGNTGDRTIINAVKTSGNLETKIVVYPPDGSAAEIISAYTGFGTWSDQVDWQLKQTGLYTIVIEDGGLVNSGTYNVSLLEIPGSVNSSADPDGGPIASGETLSGTINVASDVDAFQFYGNTGDRTIINAVTTSGDLETKIFVYPPDGSAAEIISAYTGFGTWSDQVDWQLKQTGLYTIVIEDGGLVNSGTYNISLLEIPGSVNSPGDPDGGPIASGETLSGTINVASDVDAFQFYGNTGDRTIINAVTTSGDLETKIFVYPPDGSAAEIISAYTGFGTWSDQVNWQLKQTGLYTIVIEDGGLVNSGTYNISLNKIPSTIRPGIYHPSPDNTETLCSLRGSFSWDAVSGAIGYDFYFGEGVTVPLDKIGDNLTANLMPFPVLELGKTYFWHVVAHTPTGDIQGPYWWFEAVPVLCPSQLTAKAISTSEIVLGWRDNSNNETGFALERKDGICSSTNPWGPLTTLPANTKTFTDSSLSAGMLYSYRLYAQSDDGDSLYTNCASSKTGNAGSPNSPSGLNATSQGASSILLQWTDNSSDEKNFKVFRKAGTGLWTRIALLPSGTVNYTDTSATGNDLTTSHSYYVVACNTSGCSPSTPWAIVPFKPTGLSANKFSSSRIDLSWIDNSAGETGFQIYRKSGGCISANPWTLVATKGANVQAYSNPGLSAGTYSYEVRSNRKSAAVPDAYGYSMFTNCVKVTVP